MNADKRLRLSGRYCLKGQAPGHGGEFVAGADTRDAEAGFEDFSNGWDKRRSAGQEDHVDLSWPDSARLHKRVDTLLNLSELLADPGLKITPANHEVELYGTVLELEP